MRNFTFLPWDLDSWRRAFRESGHCGIALVLLFLADALALPTVNVEAHEGTLSIILFRIPLSILAALFMLSRPNFDRLGLRDLRFWFFIYLVYYTASIVWSTAPVETAGKAIELVVAFLIVMRAAQGPNGLFRLDGLYRLVLLVSSTLAVLTLIGFFLRIPAFIMRKPGIFTQTTAESSAFSANGLGYYSISLLIALAAEYLLLKRPLAKLFPQLLFATVIFAFASSRASLGILMIGILIVTFRRSKLALVAMGIGLAAGGYLFGSKIAKLMTMHQSQATLDTLDGRVIMWIAAYHEWKRHPWLGYGGGVGGKYVISKMMIASLEHMSHLHSGIMECLTSLGAIGLFIGLTVFIASMFRLAKIWKLYPEYSVIFSWIATFVIQSIMSEGVLGWLASLLWIYMIYITMLDLLSRENLARRALQRQQARALQFAGG